MAQVTYKTFVKPQNLFLYFLQQLAHLKGMLKSLIFGQLQSYGIQNSKRSNFISATKAIFGHLLNRGYSSEVLAPLFREAAATIDNKTIGDATRDYTWERPQSSTDDRVFIHWEYHPRCIGRAAIRQTFQLTLAPALTESGLKAKPLTIAFSTPKSLGQCLTKTRLEEPPDERVSSYIK